MGMWNVLDTSVICRLSLTFPIIRTRVKSSKWCVQDIFEISKSSIDSFEFNCHFEQQMQHPPNIKISYRYQCVQKSKICICTLLHTEYHTYANFHMPLLSILWLFSLILSSNLSNFRAVCVDLPIFNIPNLNIPIKIICLSD